MLLAFVGISADGDLLGWPIPLLGSAVALLVIGLRPSTPLPTEPPPGAGGTPPSDPLPVQPLR